MLPYPHYCFTAALVRFTAGLFSVRKSPIISDFPKALPSGLLVLPFSLVSKPGEHSNYEKTFYKYHTLIGDYLLTFPLFKEIKKIVRLHHERIDGKGFLKKKEEEIPICCKIISICDTFDLMVTSNLLSARMSYKEALEKLSSLCEKKKINRKKRFEKKILDVFIEMMQGEHEFPDMNEIVKNL